MKKKFLLFSLIGLVALSGCKKGDTDVTTDKEAALQRAMTPYVENTVIATYSAMADEGLKLLDKCQQIFDAVQNERTDYGQTIEEACVAWRAMRKHWEQSEAFLFGPAAAHNIDPHIDSWPLDFNQMNALLKNVGQMADIEENGVDYVKSCLGYALQGFHACEYMLFESVEKEGRAIGTGKPHDANLSKAEAAYLLGVVEDLVQQTILLEDSWAGSVSEQKAAVIMDGDESMSYGENYGEYLINAGKAGSIYKTYQEAAEEIIAGCVDIAGEVADLKMGNPYISSTPDQRDYIESPYSCTSKIDFADNIRSIRHAYCGAQVGDYAISNYIYQKDAELDGKVRAAIDASIAAIEAIEDFENTAKGNAKVKAAIDQVSELEELLDDEVLPLLSK